METNFFFWKPASTIIVALNYSPQGDGNITNPVPLVPHYTKSHLTIPRKGMETN